MSEAITPNQIIDFASIAKSNEVCISSKISKSIGKSTSFYPLSDVISLLPAGSNIYNSYIIVIHGVTLPGYSTEYSATVTVSYGDAAFFKGDSESKTTTIDYFGLKNASTKNVRFPAHAVKVTTGSGGNCTLIYSIYAIV